MPEPVNEMDERNKPIKTHNKYYVQFTNDREEALRTIFERSIAQT